MYKRTLVPALLILALFCLGYALYRSTIEQVTTTVNGSTVVYNEPQHGFLLGLCILAGLSIAGAVALILDRRDDLISNNSTHSHHQSHAQPVHQQPITTTSTNDPNTYGRRPY